MGLNPCYNGVTNKKEGKRMVALCILAMILYIPIGVILALVDDYK